MVDANAVILALKKEFPVPEIDPVCLPYIISHTKLMIAMG
jgi:hypothetical protein